MIWSSTASGAESLGDGWLASLHPEDVEPTKKSFQKALALHAPFTFRYRLKHIEQGYIPVVVAATPSFSPIDGSFIGYIGAITEADTLDLRVPDHNVIGYSAAIKPGLLTSPTATVDIIADQLLMARAMAMNAGAHRMLPSLDFAISEVMREIGKSLHSTVQ